MRTLLLGTAVYVLLTFPLAVGWHITLFEEKYLAFGYFGEEPQFVFGFLSMLFQGLVLSFLYPRIVFSGSAGLRALKFAFLMGVFFWTSHVLAFVAKHPSDSSLDYMLMESFFLFLQFGLFGVVIRFIHKPLKYGSPQMQ